MQLLALVPSGDQAGAAHSWGKLPSTCKFRQIWSIHAETIAEGNDMNAGIEPQGSAALVERAKSIILKPKDEWPKIEAEASSQGDILRSYVLPLAAIGPVATLIGGQVFGYGAFGFSYRPSLMGGITTALISFVMSIVAVYVLTYIADFLAPKFAGTSNKDNAFKLVAYGYTAAWLVGIFSLIPMLGVFGLLGLYSLYLLFTGVTPLMKVPEDKAIGYTAVTILCAIALAIVIAPITAVITGLFVAGPALMTDRSGSSSSGTFTLPGGGEIDLGDAQNVQKQVEAAVSGGGGGTVKSLQLDDLKNLMPEQVGSFERIAMQTTNIGALGSSGEATYRNGDDRFDLTVTAIPLAGAIAGMAGAFGVNQSREDENGYERTKTVDGQMQTEKWNRSTKRGKFGKVVAGQFMVEASGSADSIDPLKAAVNGVDEGDLKGLLQ
ncbi:MAG: Yip1 family protein [Novosphingobium sp.]|nr:Yip1 family protein [Novosphingobium sp.]